MTAIVKYGTFNKEPHPTEKKDPIQWHVAIPIVIASFAGMTASLIYVSDKVNYISLLSKDCASKVVKRVCKKSTPTKAVALVTSMAVSAGGVAYLGVPQILNISSNILLEGSVSGTATNILIKKVRDETGKKRKVVDLTIALPALALSMVAAGSVIYCADGQMGFIGLAVLDIVEQVLKRIAKKSNLTTAGLTTATVVAVALVAEQTLSFSGFIQPTIKVLLSAGAASLSRNIVNKKEKTIIWIKAIPLLSALAIGGAWNIQKQQGKLDWVTLGFVDGSEKLIKRICKKGSLPQSAAITTTLLIVATIAQKTFGLIGLIAPVLKSVTSALATIFIKKHLLQKSSPLELPI